MPNFRKEIKEVRRDDLIREEDINSIIREVNAMNIHASTKDSVFLGGTSGERNNRIQRDPDTIKVKNTTGSALTALRPVLGLGDPLLNPEDTNREAFGLPIIEGVEPASSHAGKFAVLYGKAEDDDVVDAVVSGATWVRVLVNSESHEYADVDAGDVTRLGTTSDGTARILYLAPDEEGEGDDERWALVRLSNGGGGDCTCDEVHEFYTNGPTSGTFKCDYTVGGSTEELTWAYNATATQVATEFATHTELTSGEISVDGGPWPSVAIYVTFNRSSGSNLISFPTIDNSSLSGGEGFMRKFSTVGT